MIVLRPSSKDEANGLIRRWHSHHKPVRRLKWAIAAEAEEEVVGVVVVEHPKAPAIAADRWTLEVTRLCTNGHRNAASCLLGACWRAAKAMGARRLVSYTRQDEEGTCYQAAGWWDVKLVRGEAWDHGNKADRWLPGLYEPTTEIVDRVRWEVSLPGFGYAERATSSSDIRELSNRRRTLLRKR